eukprot:gene8462-9369_t
MSMFKDGIMRSAQKSNLKNFSMEGVSPIDVSHTVRIADGGALLWCCDWKKDETFEIIFQRYSQFLTHLGIDTIVFDRYSLSTKDATHQKRAGKMSQTVEIRNDNSCPSNQNKETFVKALSKKLETNFKVLECPSDADTSIVKEALTAARNAPVTVFSDDTDVLCLLVHHVAKNPTPHDIFLTNMTRKKNKQREFYAVKDVIEKFDDDIVDCLLFAHAFTGCDTTSAIHMFGKTVIFRKLQTSALLKSIAANFYVDQSPQEIGNVCIRFFELLHLSSDSLPQIRKTKYEQMVMSDRSNVDPSLLPPSPRAAFYHGLRVYHQVKVWRELKNSDYMPLDWGWQLKEQSFVPIMTDEEAGPQDLLQIIRCGCKGSCDNNRCTCRKAGLHCTASCKECHGTLCSNTKRDDDCGENDLDKDFDSLDDFF